MTSRRETARVRRGARLETLQTIAEIDSPFRFEDWGPERFPAYYRMCAELGLLPFRPADDAESAP